MFGIDEKTLADNRTLVSINQSKNNVDAILKNGTINYVSNDNTLWLTTPRVRKNYIEKKDYISQLDKIITAENGSLIKGSYCFEDNTIFKNTVTIQDSLTVMGDFKVTGNMTQLDSNSTVIEDNIITLNRNETGDGISLKKSGTAINRGKKPFARYLYNEEQKCFVIDTNERQDGEVTNWLVLAHSEDYGAFKAGDVRIRYRLLTPNIDVNTVVVNDNAKINNLNVNGISTFSKSATFNNPVTINETLTTLHVDINDSLKVKKNAEIQGQLKANGLISSETSTFNEITNFNKGIIIKSQGINSTGNLNITGNALITGTITSNENAIFKKDVNVTSSITSSNNIVTNKTSTKLLDVSSDTLILGKLEVKGLTRINDAIRLSKEQTVLNSPTTINNSLTINENNLILNCDKDGNNANIVVGGNITANKNLTIKGNQSITGSLTTGNLIASQIKSNNSFYSYNIDGAGYGFWNSNSYKIYMSNTSNINTGGQVDGAKNSDYNMYFLMNAGTNRGFVFKNNTTAIAQIESDGTFRTINHIYAKGSQVLRVANMGHTPTNETPINACMVDGKHSNELLLRNGTQGMTGTLQMNTNAICWNSNSYFKYYPITDETEKTYTGYYKFSSNYSIENTILEAGALDIKGLYLTGHNSTISGIKVLQGKYGKILTSTDEWLRINDDSSHNSGIYFGSSIVRTDGIFQIGSNGQYLNIDKNSMKYKGYNVLTTLGDFKMLGSINMGASKITFNNDSNSGTGGAGDSDNAAIYAEHDKDTQNSRLIIQMLDDANDAIILKTANNGNFKNNLIINYNKTLFNDNPYFGNNRLLHTGDTGSGNGLNVDLLDGKHYSDLQNEFVNTTGDIMTGELTMKKNIKLTNYSSIILNENPLNHIRAGATNYEKDIVLSSSRDIYFNSNGSTLALLKQNGTMFIKNSQVITQNMYGHGNGLNADTLDGKHFSDINNNFIHKAGDTFTGNISIQTLNPTIVLNAVGTKSTPNSTAGIYYKNTNNQNLELIFTEYDGELPEVGLGVVIRTTNNCVSQKAILNVEGNIYSNNKRVITGNDKGHGKGFDSDTLDGKHASEFATNTHNHDNKYVLKNEINLNQKYKIQYNNSNNSLDFMYIS